MTIICFSHLRWNFVYQRPQHLFSRFAKDYTVYFIEEPMYDAQDDHYTVSSTEENVFIVIPHLNNNHEKTLNRNKS